MSAAAWAHHPTEAALAAQSAIRAARASGGGLHIAGAGCWLDAGRPVRAAHALSMAPHAGIVDYVAGDLTLTALAGTTLGEIRRATAAEGQWLALDPGGGDDGTIGATVATASYGPLAHSFGTPRDAVLGLEFVSGSGDVARGGGRVVKNVAGFDLVRLMTGAWGTLGALTEITVRLRARPRVDETVAVALPGDAALGAWLAALRAAPLVALALELLSPELAASLGMERRPLLLARLGGNDALVRAQRATLAGLADLGPAPADVWERLAIAEPDASAACRYSAPPSRIAETWAHACAVAEDAGGYAHATVGRGVARAVLPAPAGVRAAFLRPNFTGRRVYERLPAALWAELAPSAVADELSQRVARAFDPDGALNPGVLGPRVPEPTRQAS